MATSTGQITIMTYNDSLTLTGFISSNNTRTQMYTPDIDSYTPDYTKEHLVLTPALFKTGAPDNIISANEVKSIKWYEVTGGKEVEITEDSNYELTETKPCQLTIKTNVMSKVSGKDYICKIEYNDSGVIVNYKMAISLSRVVNGTGLSMAKAWCPKGNVFKNGNALSLSAKCDLWKGSVIEADKVEYQWYKFDDTCSDDEGAGVKWKKLTDADGKLQGATQNTINVFPEVLQNNMIVLKCAIKDTDTDSATHNESFYDTIVIYDASDIIHVEINSTGGNFFKNGKGTSTLTCRAFRGGKEVDTDGKLYTYKWTKYNEKGEKDTSFGNDKEFKTGKTIVVTSDDVKDKATFICNVE